VQIAPAGSSGDLLPPSPPAEKATACQDQGRRKQKYQKTA
jgi:hypothetical protein